MTDSEVDDFLLTLTCEGYGIQRAVDFAQMDAPRKAQMTDHDVALKISHVVIDSTTEQRHAEWKIRTSVLLLDHAFRSKPAITERVAMMLWKLATHEIEEQFKISGVRYYDPHPELSKETN